MSRVEKHQREKVILDPRIKISSVLELQEYLSILIKYNLNKPENRDVVERNIFSFTKIKHLGSTQKVRYFIEMQQYANIFGFDEKTAGLYERNGLLYDPLNSRNAVFDYLVDKIKGETEIKVLENMLKEMKKEGSQRHTLLDRVQQRIESLKK